MSGETRVPDGEPGYCACCRQFRLLDRRPIAALSQPVPVCRFCAELGDAELAWRLAGVTGDGTYGYGDTVTAPLRGRGFPGGRRRERVCLAESLLLDDAGEGGFPASGVPRHGFMLRARLCWLRVRGRI